MENNLSLYQIADNLSKLEELVEEDASLIPYLDSAVMTLENKIDNIVKFRQGLIVTASAIDTEILRLTELKKSKERQAERLASYMAQAMIAHNITKVDTGLFKVSFRPSKTVEILDMESIDKKFLKEKTTVSVDKKAIKDAIEQGESVTGAELVSHKNIQIK